MDLFGKIVDLFYKIVDFFTKVWTFLQNRTKLWLLNKIVDLVNKIVDLLFRKGGSSAPREPPWLRAYNKLGTFSILHLCTFIIKIKTYGSKSRGQEEAGRMRQTSELFTGSTVVKFANTLNKPS